MAIAPPSSLSTCNNNNEDTLELWADDYFEEEGEEATMVPEDDFLFELKSKRFNSVLKTVFFKLTGLIIAQIEGKINEENFEKVVKEYLLEYTQNCDLVDKLAKQTYHILQELKLNMAETGNLITVSEEDLIIRRKKVFSTPLNESILFYLMQISDFSLVNRIEIGLYAVMLEMGFKQFNQMIRNQIESIRQMMHMNILPVYQRGIDLVINDTIYTTNRTYGILYNKFYNRIVKQFVDKV